MKRCLVVLALCLSSLSLAGPEQLVGRWGAFGEELWVLNADGSGSSEVAHARFRWSVEGSELRLNLAGGEVRQVRFNRLGEHLVLDTGEEKLYAVRLTDG